MTASRSVLNSPLLWRRPGVAGRVRWQLNERLVRRPGLLNAMGARLTVVDAYGALGDTVLTASVCRQVRERFPRLRLNFLTPNPELVRHDPNFDTLNGPETYFSVWSWYPNFTARPDPKLNILSETFGRLGIANYEYRARLFLTEQERAQGRELLGSITKPVLTFHTLTTNPVKEWPLDRWRSALAGLQENFHLVHLGDDREPEIPGVQRLAGRLSLRESLGVLAHARVHTGPDSFLMHAANGLEVPAVIIFGGSRTPENFGYGRNTNLFVPMPCGPCWIPTAKAERCDHGVACMEKIAPVEVVAAINRLGRSSIRPQR